MKEVKFEKSFAWRPVKIRNWHPLLGFVKPHWTWFRFYTRVLVWNKKLNKYRTHDTYLGWRIKQ